MFANGSRRVQRGVAKCKAPRGEASRLVPVLVPRRCDDHFIPFIPSSIITRSNAAQAPTYITVVEGLGLSPYNLLVGAQILKQVYTSCFGLHKSFCTLTLLPGITVYYIEVLQFWIPPGRCITWEMGGSQFTMTLWMGYGQN